MVSVRYRTLRPFGQRFHRELGTLLGRRSRATRRGSLGASVYPLRRQADEPAPADVRIELRRGATAISSSSPYEAAAQCAACDESCCDDSHRRGVAGGPSHRQAR